MKKKKLDGKVAVITGASQGIGYSIAKKLIEQGCKVYDISKNMIPHDEFARSFEGNVNDSNTIAKILNNIFTAEGQIDIFINNAGMGIAGAIENATENAIELQVKTNLLAVINLSKLAIHYLKLSKGKLINISSVGGIIPLPYQATYSVTKAGVEVFSRALANEVKPYGVSVTAILPGDTKTGFTSARIFENDMDDARVNRAIKKAEKEELQGMSPDCVGKVVTKVVCMKNPPLRKTVGGVYKLLVWLVRFLPTRFLNFLVRKIYC